MQEEDYISGMLVPRNESSNIFEEETVSTINKTHFYPVRNKLDLMDPFEFDGSMYQILDYDYPEWELPQSSQIALITIYSVTSVLAIGGNLVAILVLTLASRSKTDLNKYLVNLAVADLLMACFCIPFTFTQAMLGRWLMGQVMCPLVLFIQVTTVGVSIFTNTAIGMDRFLAVQYPLWQRITKAWTRCTIPAIWAVSMALSSVMLAFGRSTKQFYAGKEYWECGEYWPSLAQRKAYTAALVIVTYVVPLTVLSVTYYRIGVTLWQRRAPGNADVVRDQVQINSKRKVTKMLVALVVVFAVCWLPIHLFNLAIDLAPQLLQIATAEYQRVFLGVYFACHWLAMANSFANPLIYCFFNENFRVDMKYLVTWVGYRCFYRCCHKHLHSHRNSVYLQEPVVSRAVQRELPDELYALHRLGHPSDILKANTELGGEKSTQNSPYVHGRRVRPSKSETNLAVPRTETNFVFNSAR